ncbi:MAG: hypothetical protein ACO1TH_16800 [Luteitalea sp.]
MSSAQACREVAGLLLRRQFLAWLQWRPWLALLGLLMPLGFTLSHVSRHWADAATIHVWLYINTWTMAILQSSGARRDLVGVGGQLLFHFGTLVFWSFLAGLAGGRLSRGTTYWVGAAVFCFVVFAATIGTTTLARANPLNAPAFQDPSYWLLLPFAVRVGFVVLPALEGMRRGRRPARLSRAGWAIVFIAVLVVTGLAAPSLQRSLDAGRLASHAMSVHDAHLHDRVLTFVLGPPHAWIRRWLIPALMVWPAAYLVATSCVEQWRHPVRRTSETKRI